MAAALVSKVCRLTIGRKGYEASEAAARATLEGTEALRSRLLDLADEDSAAYRRVSIAMALPRTTEEAKAHRRREVDRSLLAAAEVPRRTAEACLQVAREAHAMAPLGNRNAISDLGVAALLSHAGLVGALTNVEVNVAAMGSAAPAALGAGAIDPLRKESERLLSATLVQLRQGIA